MDLIGVFLGAGLGGVFRYLVCSASYSLCTA